MGAPFIHGPSPWDTFSSLLTLYSLPQTTSSSLASSPSPSRPNQTSPLLPPSLMTGIDDGGVGRDRPTTTIHDLPDAILTDIISAITDVRTRNNASLVSQKWRQIERSTRTSLSLRGNLRDLFLLPTSFSSVAHLDLSHLSPWGHPFLNQIQNVATEYDELHNQHQLLIAHRLHQAFPNLESLVVYARNPSTLRVLAHHWPGLRHVSLVRWHQRPPLDPPGADLDPLFSACPNLTSLDLSRFYCWTEDIPAALQAHPASAASLLSLDLLSPAISDGFKSSEIVAMSAACPNLRCLRAPCVFNPMHFNFVGDDALLDLADNCPRLSTLHLVDPAADQVQESDSGQDSGISAAALRKCFMSLPLLEDLTLDLCESVVDAGPALEVLGNSCPRMKTLKLGRFQGICRAAGLHLDGVSVCGGLQSLSIKNSGDLTDAGLYTIARGCSRLSRFEILGCGNVTEMGITKMAGMLRSTIVDVKISRCRQLHTAASLRALAPVRDRIERLHVDCNWVDQEPEQQPTDKRDELTVDEVDDAEFCEFDCGNWPNKKCRYAEYNNGSDIVDDSYWSQSWERLRYLSLWLPAGEVLSPLPNVGLDFCPELEEISIKIEGDCRTCRRPTQRFFGLTCLSIYDKLSKMKLDCGDAVGYAFTAPMGHMDLSLWERFYLHGIGSLETLHELDYWPPQDPEVNQRSLSLPAAGLIQECAGLRKLFVHGTAHEHFMMFFLKILGLRDVQLREDYYPAPEDDMSTEMRVDSCSRFEDALHGRGIPD